jgi:hypothetical protein
MWVDEDSFAPWEDQNFVETCYNTTRGLLYRFPSSFLNTVEEKVLDSFANRKALRRILSLLLSSRFPEEVDGKVMELAFRILGMLESDVDTLVTSGRISRHQKVNLRVFFRLLQSMSDSTLFTLARDKGLVNVYDELGVKKDDIEQYIIREQIRRYKNDPKLDMRVRDLLNELGFEDKEKLLALVYDRKKGG